MKKSLAGRVAILATLVAVVLLQAACEQKSIREILADPGRYQNKTVGVTAKVVRSYSILGKGAYEVDDGTGRLWVVSEKGVPRTGADVAVKGKIRNGFDLGSVVKLPEAMSSGIVMIEESHRTR